MNKDKFWTQIMPTCLAEFKTGAKLAGFIKASDDKNFSRQLKTMDQAEFNLLMAKVVIKASGQGIVGVDLTGRINLLKSLREE